MLSSEKKELFEHLFKDHFHQLYVHAYGWVYDEECAKDIVHDSYCYLWEHFDRYEDHNNLRALLYTFIRSRCSDYLRHLQAVKNYTDYQQIWEEDIAIEDYTDYQERLEKVRKTIDQFPLQMRSVFTECVLNSRSYKEVAEQLQISPLTVKTLVSRAYKKLRDKMTFLTFFLYSF